MVRLGMIMRYALFWIMCSFLCDGAVCPIVITKLKWHEPPPMTSHARTAEETWFEIGLFNSSQKKIVEVELDGETGVTTNYLSKLPYAYFVQNFRDRDRLTEIFPSHKSLHYQDSRWLAIWVRSVTFRDGSHWEGNSNTCRKQVFTDQPWTYSSQFMLGGGVPSYRH